MMFVVLIRVYIHTGQTEEYAMARNFEHALDHNQFAQCQAPYITKYRVSKKPDSFHIQISCELIAGIFCSKCTG